MEDGTALHVAGNVNVFYLTGRFYRGYVWLPKEGDPVYFIVKPHEFEELDSQIYIRKPEQIPSELEKRGISAADLKVGLEEDVLSYSDTRRLMAAFGAREYFNGTGIIRSARMVKTPYELDRMRFDGKKQAEVYGSIGSLYRPGMTDVQLQIAIERELRLHGALGYTRVSGNLMDINMGSVLAGDNADCPSPYEFAMGGEGTDPSLPGGANGTVIEPGMTVMVDMSGAFNAYQTDMTRVWWLGELPESAYKAHRCSIEILDTLTEEALPGREVCELYFRAVEIAEKAGLADYFMGHRQKSGFIGHGVGLELNEMPPIAPRCKVPLKSGMTIALEPKFVIPGVGAVGVENTYIVRPEGLENITRSSEEIHPLG